MNGLVNTMKVMNGYKARTEALRHMPGIMAGLPDYPGELAPPSDFKPAQRCKGYPSIVDENFPNNIPIDVQPHLIAYNPHIPPDYQSVELRGEAPEEDMNLQLNAWCFSNFEHFYGEGSLWRATTEQKKEMRDRWIAAKAMGFPDD